MTIFFGHSPPPKSPLVTPFVGTPSGMRLSRWMGLLGDPDWLWANVSPVHVETLTNLDPALLDRVKRLCKEVVERGGSVVALGNEVSSVLKKLKVEHFTLPHPSFLNRKLNDSAYESSVLNDCKLYMDGWRS